jgi:hypothetical protein
LSQIIFKDNSSKELFNQILKDDALIKQQQMIMEQIICLNGPQKCHVCKGGITMDCDTHLIQPLIKHHVDYSPEVIAYVHFKCHQKIHDIKNPIKYLIKYEEGDSVKFYNLKKQQVMGGITA